MDLAQRAALVAARAIEKGRPLDQRDRSEPAALRIEHERPAPPRPAPVKRTSKAPAPVKLEARHLEPVEPFTCPRCGQPADGQPFYGPCGKCQGELGAGGNLASSTLPCVEEGAPLVQGAPSAVLRRTQRRHRARVTVWRQVTAEVAQLLHELPAGTERVYICGRRPGLTAAGDRAWFLGQLPDGWSHHPDGHYLGGQHPVGKYLDPAGTRVEVHRAASWYGEGDYTPAQAQAAHEELADLFGRHPLLATPATTGRELLVRTIPEREGGWPCLSADHQELVRSTSGQGRMELFTEQGQVLDGLHEYDGRFMYAGLCRQLGAGPATLHEGPGFDRYARARYLVAVQVPAGWDGPGLLGHTSPDGGWCYPSTPRARFSTWADGAELHLAQRHGWTFTVQARLELADSKANPLGAWAERLVKMRQAAIMPMAQAALRRVLLMAVGTLHGRPHRVTRVVELADAGQVPDDSPAQVLGGQVAYEVSTGQAWPALAHPEWTSAIWARGRTRLLSGPTGQGALHLGAGQLVAMRTDALYVTRRQHGWEEGDDGRPGRLEYRGGRDGQLQAPTSVAELLAARTWRDEH